MQVCVSMVECIYSVTATKYYFALGSLKSLLN